MVKKKEYPKLVRILVASVMTPILGLITFPIWTGMAVVAHYGFGLSAFMQGLLVIPFLFTLMMTVLVFFFRERSTIKWYKNPTRFLILLAIILLESIIFILVYKVLQVPYLWIDSSKIFEPVNTTMAMLIIYPTFIIIAAFIADSGLTVYNKYVLQANNV